MMAALMRRLRVGVLCSYRTRHPQALASVLSPGPACVALSRSPWTRRQRSTDVEPGSATLCWNCQSFVNGGASCVCRHCKCLQPLATATSFFEVLGVKSPSFDVDLRAVEQTYKNLQRQLHPDRHANKSKDARDVSDSLTAYVNEAYTTLKSPLLRAKYLLNRCKVPEDDETTNGMDPEFLMETMELRETIEDLEDASQLNEIWESLKAKEARAVQDISAAFKGGQLDKAAGLINELKYVARSLAAAEYKAESLERTNA